MLAGTGISRGKACWWMCSKIGRVIPNPLGGGPSIIFRPFAAPEVCPIFWLPSMLAGRCLDNGKACWRMCSKIRRVIPHPIFWLPSMRAGRCLDTGKACWWMCSKIRRVIPNPWSSKLFIISEPFSTFDDKLRYCGSTPLAGYCKAFTSSPSQISAHCDGNSTSQESGALDDDSDSDSDIDGNAYKDEPPPEAGPSRVNDDEFSFMDGDEIESAMADFDMSTLDDIVSDPLVQLKNPTPSTPASRTLEDIWHVKDQLLRILLHGHSAFKPFAAALTLSTFVCDRNDRRGFEQERRDMERCVMQADRKNTPPCAKIHSSTSGSGAS
ncbi:hypothetical protein C8J57DRAFT_1226303 [Mycena rebaudengoi]|nr:hypothetical protein C8J57DRAFT_1226303 [Mycena rebaudengoi]